MKQIIIEPLSSVHSRVTIECECGSGVKTNPATQERGFKHNVALKVSTESVDVVLWCDCGKKFGIRPQDTHFHVFEKN